VQQYLASKKGQPVEILCARYSYSGIVAEVTEDYVVLTNATLVESAGPATGKAPSQEDTIPSDIMIAYGAIEHVCQPTWVFRK